MFKLLRVFILIYEVYGSDYQIISISDVGKLRFSVRHLLASSTLPVGLQAGGDPGAY